MELHGRQVILRAPRTDDADRLNAILAEPSVAAWWPEFDVQRVRDDLIAERMDEEGFVIEHEGSVVGYIQLAEEPDPEFRHASIDLFLTTEAQGHGLGPDAIRAVAIHLIDDRGHHRLTIDPAATNARAIAAYA
jgi:aminoglycoside 6'-N-acetyltransferase